MTKFWNSETYILTTVEVLNWLRKRHLDTSLTNDAVKP